MFTVPTGMNFSSRLNGFCLLSCGPGYKYPGYPLKDDFISRSGAPRSVAHAQSFLCGTGVWPALPPRLPRGINRPRLTACPIRFYGLICTDFC